MDVVNLISRLTSDARRIIASGAPYCSITAEDIQLDRDRLIKLRRGEKRGAIVYHRQTVEATAIGGRRGLYVPGDRLTSPQAAKEVKTTDDLVNRVDNFVHQLTVLADPRNASFTAQRHGKRNDEDLQFTC